MKTKVLLFLGLFACSFLILTSCDDDESGTVNLDASLLTEWETAVAEARELAATSVEGSFPGDFFEGSIAKFEEDIALAQDIVDRATEDIRIKSALLVLEFAIKEFNASLVEEAIPLFSNPGSEILATAADVSLAPDEFTVELRVKLQSYDAGQIVADMVGTLNQTSGLNTSGWALRYFTTPWGNADQHGMVDFIIGSGDDGVYFTAPNTAASGYVIPLDEWVHIAATYNNQNMKLYVDGALIFDFNSSVAINPDPAGTIFRIGNSVFKDGRYTNGNLTDVRFWNVERTEAEIIANMDDYLETPFESGLKVYFPLNANLGNSITDATGNYKADITGVTWE